MSNLAQQFRFLRENRLTQRKQFDVVFRDSARFSDEFLVFLVHKSHHSTSRLGLVVKKKYTQNQPHRNWVKRTIRETFRVVHTQFDPCDIVVINRKLCTRPQFRSSVEKIWKKIIHAYSNTG